MDQFAKLSQDRAVANIDNGFFAEEIVPVTLPDGTVVSTDDGPRAGTTLEGLGQLKPVFRPDGTITAGNACPLNDGAAAVVVMSDTKAAELGLTPLARIVSSGVTGLNPEIMGLGPIEASRQALARAGMTIDDIDLVEINEAFAAQVIPSAKHLGIDWEKLNVHGGGIALGHPFGMTGAAHHDHADPRPAGRRQDVRPGDDVRRRRPGHGDGGRAPQLRRSDWLIAGKRTICARSGSGERKGSARMHTTVGLAGISDARTRYCSPPLDSAPQRPAVVPQGLADAVGLEGVDVEPGRLGLGPPQVDETAAELGIVDQVVAVEVQLDVGDRHRFELLEVDHVAAELAVEHHHHRAVVAGGAADEPVAHERQTVLVGGRPPDPVAEPEAHPGDLGEHGVGQRRPAAHGVDRPVVEGPVGQGNQAAAGGRVDPHHRAGATEVAVRGGVVRRAGPVR